MPDSNSEPIAVSSTAPPRRDTPSTRFGFERDRTDADNDALDISVEALFRDLDEALQSGCGVGKA